jgi:hypothetical protein
MPFSPLRYPLLAEIVLSAPAQNAPAQKPPSSILGYSVHQLAEQDCDRVKKNGEDGGKEWENAIFSAKKRQPKRLIAAA